MMTSEQAYFEQFRGDMKEPSCLVIVNGASPDEVEIDIKKRIVRITQASGRLDLPSTHIEWYQDFND